MKLDPKVASGPIAALVALLLISLETADALHRAGSSRATPVTKAQVDDPVTDFEEDTGFDGLARRVLEAYARDTISRGRARELLGGTDPETLAASV